MGSKIDALTAGAAVLSAVGACLAVNQAGDAAGEAQESADEAQSIAARAQDLLERQDREQYARLVYLGEAPAVAYQRFPAPRGEIWTVVMNASGLQVENVWVTNEAGQSIAIQGLQRCSMYALPVGFHPADLYFTDPFGAWHRHYGDQVEEVAPGPPPSPDTGGDPPWYDTVTDCGG